MRIVIPTRGRVDRQLTLERVGAPNRAGAILVCPSDEAPRHRRRWPEVEVVEQPDDVTTIARKRQWIVEQFFDEKILMLDDDMDFFHRVRRESDGKMRLRTANGRPEIVAHWFGELESRLCAEVPHAGFGPRMHNDKQPEGWVGPARMMFALGYHVPTVLEHVELGRINTREDMDVCLQLLRKGLTNVVTHEFAVGPGAYGQPGGCSDERTVESSNADAHKLAELHPGYVRVAQRTYKNVPRLEVSCAWARALRDGQLGSD